MNKESKTLPQAIKFIVDTYGKKVVNNVQMVNIMNDLVSLEDPSAVKTILHSCVKLGYGHKILALSPKDDCHLKIRSYSKTISDSHGYKEVIVQYILYSIAYGIGLFPNEPYLKNNTQKKRVYKIKETSIEEHIETRKSPILKIAAITFVLLIAGIYGYNYWTSSKEREQYKEKMSIANTFLSNGDYTNAVESYKEAYNGYNAMNSDSYKRDALNKINEIADQLIKEGDNNNKSLLQAQKIVTSELLLDLNEKDKEQLRTKLSVIDNTIEERTDNGRNSVITNLSANNGKLDEKGKQLLEEILELSPDDYWLNFIKKKKSYE